MAPKASTKRKLPERSPPINLEYEQAARPRLKACKLLPQKPQHAFQQGQELVAMVVDVVEGGGGRFSLWGTTPEGCTVHVRVTDFRPYFYIAAPKKQVAAPDGASVGEEDYPTDPRSLGELQELLNRFLSRECSVQQVEGVHRKPIMFFRPDRPQGDTYLKLSFGAGANLRKASASLAKAMSGGRFHNFGLSWRDLEMYEAEVAPLQRFLADVPLSGGAWVYVPAAPALQPTSPQPAPRPPAPLGQGGASSSGAQHGQQQQQQQGGYQLVCPSSQVSSCDIEVVAPWAAIHCLTPDATQLADPGWTPFDPERVQHGAGSLSAPEGVSETVQGAADAAKRGDIVPLKMMLMDVVSATSDGVDRVAVSGKDPIVAISCTVTTFHAAAGHAADSVAAGGPAVPISLDEEGDGEEDGFEDAELAAPEALPGAAAIPTALPPASAPGPPSPEPDQQLSVVFLLARKPPDNMPTHAHVPGTPSPARGRAAAQTAGSEMAGGSSGQGGAAWTAQEEMRERLSGAHVEVFEREDELLLSWLEFFRVADPDVVALFQVADTLETLQQRMAALGLERGSLHLSRMLHPHSRPVSIKKVTMYSAAWVRSQSRMSSTSNQETYRAEVDGRLVLDVLRQVLTGCNLASFSLVDCAQTLLGQTLEVLRPYQLSMLAGLAPPGTASPGDPASPAADVALGNALRLARYAVRRLGVVHTLLHRLATIPETIEMARATGLTLGQIQYNAQMIRTWSLLLRTARRTGYILAGRQDSIPLSEHTFIMHPVEAGTVGLYKQPVAILDFASLYPSLYRAYNLCYTTLLHKDDQQLFQPEQLTVTPTGAVFVKPEVRAGILPSILAALINARTATRAQLKDATEPAARAVLDSRQKALKVTANALYGFTGAQASPLQCVPLADSCLAYGAQSCRTAIEALQAAEAAGRLGPHGGGARVIYGHTDSLFLLFPRAKDAAVAIQAGQLASREVSAAFPLPMELKFERVCLPLMLLHVNRYAGRAFEREEEALAEHGGSLIVKGLKSMWRQAAPIVRTTLHGALVRIIMQDDVRGAVEFVEGEVRRLLMGRVDLHELVMTGGLWRVTGEQVEKAAAAEGGGPPSEEEVRGPHASLAVRLSQRDPGRTFVLGERLQYVLLAGQRLQDDAAEDPLAAAKAGAPPDLELYWRNKLQRPLTEIFATCLNQQQLQSLVGGAHTLVKVEQLSPQWPPLLGPVSPTRGKLSPGGKGRQTGLTQFYQQTAKCLGCRRSMPAYKGPLDQAPGLCDSCSGVDDKWQTTYISLLEEQSAQEARACAAHGACRQCHSGTLAQPVLCENGECPVLFARLGTRAKVEVQQRALGRLEML